MPGFEKLVVWQKSKDLYGCVMTLVDALPLRHKKVLGDQMSRASVSVFSNIAEGRARGTTKEYIHFLHIAKGSLDELRAQLLAYNMIQTGMEDTVEKSLALATEVSKMLYVLEKRLKAKI